MILDQVAAAASPEVQTNDNFETVKAAGAFGKRPATTSGLTLGYYGCDDYNGNAIAAGTLAMTDNATNYVVVLRSTGVVSVSTATTHSTDPLYARLYKGVALSGAVTWTDERWKANGLFLSPGSPATDIAAATHAATSKNPPVDADEFTGTDSASSYTLVRFTWANIKAAMWTALGALINGGTDKTTPVDADSLPLSDSAASNATKRLTWANLKATLATYIATLGYASTSYVDTVVNARSWKNAVRAASTANVTLASAVENGDTLDGVTLATGDRILLKDQSSASENGIYVVAASGAPTRATDADAGSELVNATVSVSEGSTNADRQYTCTTDAPITPGSTSLTWTQTGTGAGGITALTGDVAASGAGSVAATLATVNSNVGSFGSATQVATFTVNGKGLTTAAGTATITPAVGSITGLGTGVATALAINVGTAGAPVVLNGAGGTPSSLTLTNATGLPTAGHVDDSVTYAKMQNVSATSRALGRKTAGAGDPEELTLSELLDFIGSAAQGDILYRDSASWARLAAGTAGQFLQTAGAGANPAWVSEPFDASVFFPGAPTASAKVLRVPIARAVTFAANFSGSYAKAGTAATGSTAIDVQKNGSSVGTITFAAAGTTATFTSSGGTAVSFAAGDVLGIVAPASPDATLADIGITLAGTR